MSGGPVCILQSETVVQTEAKTFHRVYVTKFSRTFGAILAALARGFSDRHFEREEGPGDEVGSLISLIIN